MKYTKVTQPIPAPGQQHGQDQRAEGEAREAGGISAVRLRRTSPFPFVRKSQPVARHGMDTATRNPTSLYRLSGDALFRRVELHSIG